MQKLVVAVALMFTVSLNAYGADNGIYVGGALSRSSIDTDSGFFGFGFDDEDTGYKVIGGVRPLDRFAVEANYVDFGDVEFDNRGEVTDGVRSKYGARAIDAFVVGFIGVPLVEVFGKAGLVHWDTDSELEGGIGGVNLSDSDSGTDFAYGAGIQAHFASLAARLEYERFDVPGTDRMDLWSLGLTWTFL